LHKESIIGQITQIGIGPNTEYFANEFYAENDGTVDSIFIKDKRNVLRITKENGQQSLIKYDSKDKLVVQMGSIVKTGDIVYTGKVINKVFFIDFARMLLLSVFFVNMGFIYVAYKRRKREGTI